MVEYSSFFLQVFNCIVFNFQFLHKNIDAVGTDNVHGIFSEIEFCSPSILRAARRKSDLILLLVYACARYFLINFFFQQVQIKFQKRRRGKNVVKLIFYCHTFKVRNAFDYSPFFLFHSEKSFPFFFRPSMAISLIHGAL